VQLLQGQQHVLPDQRVLEKNYKKS
jgi:hypothetical protein